ncbi:MAG: ribosome biogenesis GTP-binding protein YsxC [Deltaproteobacteria bacterium]|nr:ribosome biogenesis GTP-binding protein YsxC [Deltaproteobacteria bacterium]
MKIISAALLDQAHNPGQIPSPPYPQVAVFGRSNVGKSSLLAKMMRRRKLVKVSSTPGKTRAIYYYLVNDALLLVDLPGYGFSKAPRGVANQWRSLVEAYLDKEPGPKLALHLIDIRHSPTKDDISVHRILAGRYIPSITVATKADKLSRSGVIRATNVIGRELGEPVELIVPASAKDASISADPLWDRILAETGITP